VTDADQFGEEGVLVGAAIELCVPATKDREDEGPTWQDLETGLNHFQCYRALGFPRIGPFQVELKDQFQTKLTDVIGTSLHCNPASKNQGPVPRPDDHLKCYSIADAPGQFPFFGATVTVEDQFGTKKIVAGRTTRLCERACKNDECNP
jgi:hypothetical protein